MIDPARPLLGAKLDLGARPDRQAAFQQPGSRHDTARSSTPPVPSPATHDADAAVRREAAGLKLEARLIPAAAPGQGRTAGMPVELHLLDRAARGGAALVATVVASTAERALVLDLGGHRLILPPGAVELPIGATAALQLQLPGVAAPVGEPGALDRLIGAWLRGGAGTAAGPMPATTGPTPHAIDAGLAARLLADWRSLAGRTPGAAAPAGAVPRAQPASLELRIDAESGRSILVDRDTGWRALFGLLGEAAEPPQPVTLWRRERDGTAADDGARQLVLTLDLSRLGRIVLQLDTAPGRLRLALASAEPLPQPLRAAIAEAFRAAAELAGLEPALVFRAAPGAALPLGEGSRHVADWVG